MRGMSRSSREAEVPVGPEQRRDWVTLKRLLPYLWRYRWRVLFALMLMVMAKLANIGVPLLLKELVDAMQIKPGNPAAVLVVPMGLIVAYGLLRFCTSLFTELRELVFAKATEGAARSIALETFAHLHSLRLSPGRPAARRVISSVVHVPCTH